MKVWIIGMPRSRNTWLLNTLCQEDQLTSLADDFYSIYLDSSSATFDQLLDLKISEYSHKDQWVLRMGPARLVDPWQSRPIAYRRFNPGVYSEIIFTSRLNGADSVCSFFVAEQLDSWVGIQPPFNPRAIVDYQARIRANIMQDLLAEDLQNWLTANGHAWHKVTYEQMPQYIEQRWPGVGAEVQTLDYAQLILNYDQIKEAYSTMYPAVLAEFNQWKTQYEQD